MSDVPHLVALALVDLVRDGEVKKSEIYLWMILYAPYRILPMSEPLHRLYCPRSR